MAKQKKSRSIVSADAKKKTKPVSSPLVNFLDDEDDWVIVRKLKITILIPPLPGEDVQLLESQEPEMPMAVIDNTDIPILAATSPDNSAPPESEEAKSLSQATPECSIPLAPSPILSHPKTSRKPQQFVSLGGRTSNHGLSSSTLKLRKHGLIYGDGMSLLNQSLRAVNIEKKIRRAGGLSSWLISLGLERFVKIFQQKKVNKFQLANMNMKKLKDMGAFAVGPRRKLIHALDCLCQPYCFEHVRFSAV